VRWICSESGETSDFSKRPVEKLTRDLSSCSDENIRRHSIPDLYRGAWRSSELERQNTAG
jgi:hypothetical protein